MELTPEGAQVVDAAVDHYLDQLLPRLSGGSSDVRRILAETEDHLRASIADLLDAGMAVEDAVAVAVDRFGPPARIARRFGTVRRRQVVQELITGLAGVALVGLLAIGVSGLLSIGARAAWGAGFVAGDVGGVTYTAERCADFAAYHPEARTCGAAAAAHHADEVETYRVATGALGLAALAGVWWWRRRRRPAEPEQVPAVPPVLVPAVGAAVFGAAAAALGAQALGSLTQGFHHGAGQWLTAALVAGVVALAYGWRAARNLVPSAA